MTGEVDRYLAVAALLFVIGALGFFTRRNLIVMILSVEMMLHGVAITLVTFGRLHNSFEGQVFTIFTLTVSACEAALALTLILALYQRSGSLDVELWTDLREPELPPPTPAMAEAPLVLPAPMEFPHLTAAGRVPQIRDRHDPDVVDDAASPTAESPTQPPRPDDVINTARR